MKDYIWLGSTPADETCAQVGEDGYELNAREECNRYIELLRKLNGKEPEGAKLTIKWSPHDFGRYAEVVCMYDDSYEEAINYAFEVEESAPLHWEAPSAEGSADITVN